ncbi:glucosylglycerol-phosphate synthase [Sulfurimonas sp. HSL-1656]|uniref:glucosylglycerol-phosphate synthase n=1 Tax=Thiomicrolovo subterrani TaxID=3131934 RepID=UPI0031FA1D96
MLATDLDGTFLESANKADDPLYRYLHDNPNIILVFNSGRNIELILPLLDDMSIPTPHYIIGDVGASVLDGTNLEPVQPLQHNISKRWYKALDSIADLRDRLETLERQDQPQERRLSYYVTSSTIPRELVDELSTRECDVLHSNEIYLDILPKGTSKGSTLEALVDHLGVPKERVIVAGDTLNDLSMYQHGFKGVVLNNAETPLKEAASQIEHAYFSKAPGTHGILEAMHHFGIAEAEHIANLPAPTYGDANLVMVYHRLPFQEVEEAGKIVHKKHTSPNGILPTLLGFFANGEKGSWVAWSKCESRTPEDFEKYVEVDKEQYEHLRVCRVPLTAYDVKIFYEVFSKEAFWLLLHSFHEKAVFNHDHWKHFCDVNRIFAENTAAEAAEGAVVWIHDYNLWMVPGYLRQLRPDVKIAFYHHTPFPSADIFNMLPWRRDIINSLLQCDYVGFHIPQYVDNFVNTVRSNTQIEVNSRKNAAPLFKTYGCAIGVDDYADSFTTELNTVRLGAHPVGINCGYIEQLAASDHVQTLYHKIRDEIGDNKLIVSIERTDYTKGPVDKLKAYEQFLETHPEMRGKINLFMVCTPPAKGMAIYEEITQDIAYHVGLINGRFGSYKWTPIHYVNRVIPFEDVIAYNCAADIGWVTPLRDGLNLVAKEYVAAQHAIGGNGALVLSEFAGAAVELHGAFLANPYDRVDMSNTLMQALEAPEKERASRLQRMSNIIHRYDVNAWGQDFLSSVTESD